MADREGERGEGEKVLNVVSGLLSKLNEAKIENGKRRRNDSNQGEHLIIQNYYRIINEFKASGRDRGELKKKRISCARDEATMSRGPKGSEKR